MTCSQWILTNYILSILCVNQITANPKTNITICAITNLNIRSGYDATAAQWLAIQAINNDSKLLPNYHFQLQVFDTEGQMHTALLNTLNITQSQNKNHSIYFPIILGAPMSSLSTAINPLLGAFNMGQISAASTSISLSDTTKYPYFYRTIPSDKLQAEGLAWLCNEFNWTRIAVVHANDAYGLHLWLQIQDLIITKNYDIDATSIAVSHENPETYKNAADQIKDMNIYIIILIVHDTNIFQYFDHANITDYPHYYLGVDAWFDKKTLDIQTNKTNHMHYNGFIGTVPWQTDSLPLNSYTDDVRIIINESLVKYNRIKELWLYYYNNGFATKLNNLREPGIISIYGYDAMFTIVEAIQEIENNSSDTLSTLINNHVDLIKQLNDSITRRINFIGLSGHVTFDETGERVNGYYSFGNINNGNEIDYFGYFYYNKTGNFVHNINVSKIVWPQDFIDKNMIPRANIWRHEKIKTIHIRLCMTLIILLGVSCIIALVCMIFLIYYRKNIVIKAASWRLNVIMCFGAILGYIGGILYGIDEGFFNESDDYVQTILTYLCNIKLWVLIISYTVLFIPLFGKTYRLSLLFNAILTARVVKDKKIFIGVLICVLIDITMLTIFTIIKPATRVYIDYETISIDELQQLQLKHGRCTFNAHNEIFINDWSIYGFLLFFKLCELIWGLYVALDVSRIKDITNMLTRFDETGIQLLSIFFIVIILCVGMPMYGFGPTEQPDFYYLIIGILILLIGNIVIIFNLFPRIFAVLIKNEAKYALSPVRRIEAKLKRQLKRRYAN
eukprot:550023_1